MNSLSDAPARNAFNTRALMALVLVGVVLFVVLLWMIGAGMNTGSTNNGGGHAGGKGLNGYAALASLLEKQGYTVRKARNKSALNDPGILILTPPHHAKGEEIGKIITEHTRVGPTILVLPKWAATTVSKGDPTNLSGKKGWVRLEDFGPPSWSDNVPSLGKLDVRIEERKGNAALWQGMELSGKFPDPRAIQTISTGLIEANVRDGAGQTLAGYLTGWASSNRTSHSNALADKGTAFQSSWQLLATGHSLFAEEQQYDGPSLDGDQIQQGVDQEGVDQGYLAHEGNDQVQSGAEQEQEQEQAAEAEGENANQAGKSNQESASFPVLIVAEPDLLNNYGMASKDRARLALALIDEVSDGGKLPIVMDMTLNGLGQSSNLLTLAFTPPFIAATLCFLLASLAVGWRAFLRFGPPHLVGREIAFGKRALITNAAGLINRSGRLHLAARPYADNARDRLARNLALPRQNDVVATEQAIDRAIASRTGKDNAFSTLAARLRAASQPSDIVKAAQDIHALERTLKR